MWFCWFKGSGRIYSSNFLLRWPLLFRSGKRFGGTVTRITQPADVAIFKPFKNAWNCRWIVLQKAIDAGIHIIRHHIPLGITLGDKASHSYDTKDKSTILEDRNANNSQYNVLIPIETVKEALDCIGAERLNKIWTQQGLTEEE